MPSDNAFFKLICWIVVIVFVATAIIRSLRGDKDLDV